MDEAAPGVVVIREVCEPETLESPLLDCFGVSPCEEELLPLVLDLRECRPEVAL